MGPSTVFVLVIVVEAVGCLDGSCAAVQLCVGLGSTLACGLGPALWICSHGARPHTTHALAVHFTHMTAAVTAAVAAAVAALAYCIHHPSRLPNMTWPTDTSWPPLPMFACLPMLFPPSI